MGLIIISLLLLVVGIVVFIVGGTSENISFLGVLCTTVGGLTLIIVIVLLSMKPMDIRDFEYQYISTEEVLNSELENSTIYLVNDVVEINSRIRSASNYPNFWYGIFMSKKISEYPIILLKEKEKEEE